MRTAAGLTPLQQDLAPHSKTRGTVTRWQISSNMGGSWGYGHLVSVVWLFSVVWLGGFRMFCIFLHVKDFFCTFWVVVFLGVVCFLFCLFGGV